MVVVIVGIVYSGEREKKRGRRGGVNEGEKEREKIKIKREVRG